MKFNVCPNYHFGHIVFDAFKKRPEFVSQIDAATGEELTNEAVLRKSVCLAKCLRAFGLKPGDVLAFGGRNHLDIFIPYYAAVFNGLPIVGVDPYFKHNEIRTLFEITKPKVAFCQAESYNDHVTAVRELGLDTRVFTFENGDHSLGNFMAEYDDKTQTDAFTVSEIDIDKIYLFLISTSGTTGKIKVAAFKHQPFIFKTFGYIQSLGSNYETNLKYLNLSPVNWVSSFFVAAMLPLIGHINLTTSNPEDRVQVVEIINKYKPASGLMSPSLVAYLMSRKEEVDLTCFKMVSVTGARNNLEVFDEFKARLSNGKAMEFYGLTESIGAFLIPDTESPKGSVGKVSPIYNVKLVDAESEEEINTPGVPGEMWVKGLIFSEYYNDPEATAAAFSKDGFLKTGDILYRDEKNNYFFVDRKKTLIKYRNFHVLPSELEDIIHRHPGVVDVSVVGIPDPEDGERPVACVIRKNGSTVTAQEIKNLITDNLSKNKELRGGVVFLEKFPMTSTGKIARAKLQELVRNLKRE